ncbi:MAG: LysR family transcriptional regulator [Deltaproteobacteria bacterium]|nr:LysR family transcriptional regulator [Deltaproteobacteria bacterium]
MSKAPTLASFDLNLLVQLNLLLEESSVSGAAGRAGVTQSAMSRSLARLREALDDELLVQVGRGMEPTAFARGLVEPLHSILREIDTKILAPAEFEPATAEREFSIAAIDFAEIMVLGPWLSTLGAKASGVSVNLTGPQQAFRGGLTRGELDLVIGVVSGARASLKSRRLLTDSYVTVMRRGHPLAGKPVLDVEDHTKHDHLLVSPSGRGEGHVDVALGRLGESRHVAVRASTFLVGLQLVATSDLIMTAPRLVAEHLECSSGSVVHTETGLELPELALSMLWHTTRDRDVGHTWLRAEVLAQAKRIERGSSKGPSIGREAGAES